jgi:hypothetical protein
MIISQEKGVNKMKKTTLPIFFVVILLALPLTNFSRVQATPESPARRPYFLFNSIIQLSYDQGALNNASFEPNGPPINIPITIQVRANVPDFFFRGPFQMLKIRFIWGSFIIPVSQVRLTVENPPEWAAISVNPTTPYIDLWNEWQTTNVTLTIALHDDAPPQVYSLRLKAKLNTNAAHISSSETFIDLLFKPEQIFRLSIYCPDWHLVTPPNQYTGTEITVSNLGNGWSYVTVNLTAVEGWWLRTDVSQFVLDPGKSQIVTLQLKAPEEFNGEQLINLTFTPSIPGMSGEPVPFQIIAHYP